MAQASRLALLKANKDVAHLHTRLVGSGVLGEEEFWETQKGLLEEATAKRGLGQRLGIASTFMAEPTKDGRSRQVHFSLDREKIHQIFSVRPAVCAAFLAYVPSRMTEEEFWTRYCRTMITKTARRGKAPATEQEAADIGMFAENDLKSAADNLGQARGRGADAGADAGVDRVGAIWAPCGGRGAHMCIAEQRCAASHVVFACCACAPFACGVTEAQSKPGDIRNPPERVRVSADEVHGPHPGPPVRRL